MTRFYRHLAAGRSKAEALRRAQAELRRQPAT
jgi:CHAT domain-containing protein